MPAPIQVNASRGEISPYLHARTDLDHYRGGMSLMRNWVPLRFGGFTRFPGSVYFGPTKTAARYSRFIPFEFKRAQVYAIEVGHLYFRFWNVNGRVETGPGVAYEVAHTYDEADLPFIQFRQSGDRLYLSCDGYKPKTLTRTTETNWTFADYVFDDGPYLPINTFPSVTATPNVVGVVGGNVQFLFNTITVINGGAGFSAGDVGRVFRFLASDGIWRWYRVVNVVGNDTLVGEVMTSALPNTNARNTWRLGAWGNYPGFPVSVSIFEDRLGWGGTVLEPLNAWYSQSAGYNSFAVSSPLLDDDAITVKMTGGKLNAIQWMSDARDSVMGTEGTLRAVGRNDLNGAFSPSNVRQRTESAIPSTYLGPLAIENVLILVDLYRTKLFEAQYTQNVEGYLARELTALNEHLLAQGVRDWAYQASPHKIIWMVTDEGTLLAAVYDREQEVFGISMCTLGDDAYVESICVTPGDNKDGDHVWLTVRRTIDGATVRYVELLSAFFREGFTEQDYPIYGHAAGVYTGVETNTITGADHLEGETVGVWVDGVDAGDAVVTAGEITWPAELSGTLVVFGLRYLSDARTLRLAQEERGASVLGRSVKCKEAIVDMYQSFGLEAGTPSGADLTRYEAEAEEDPYDPAQLRTGAFRFPLDDSWENNGVFALLTDAMHPATVRAITVISEVEDI